MSDKHTRAVLEKLCKWRKFFASWQLGTRLATDGEYRAVADQRELFILMRAEVTALTWILISKGVCTQQEFQDALAAEAAALDHAYEQAYPGFSTSVAGLHLKMPEALETMRRLGFPP